MKTTNTFNISRLLMVIKYDIIEDWKTYLYRFCSCYGVFLIVTLVAYKTAVNRPFESIGYAYSTALTFSALFCIMIMFYAFAADIMRVLRTKEKRIAFLMLPATKAEKFVSRALLSTIGAFIMIVVTFVLAEVTRIMLMPLLGAPEELRQTFFTQSWHMLTTFKFDDELVDLILTSLFSQSIYILGGTYFYKRPFLKTFSTCIILFVVLVFIVSLFDFSNVNYIIVKQSTAEIIGWIMDIFVFLGTIFNWGLAYWLFTRSQVIERKLILKR